MKAIKNKLQSKRGASITFALLLFLVCAVISGVVIVAATAAAGRMSEQADMDERYYAVTAVANKLITIMENENKGVKLQYTKADNIDIDDIVVTDPEGLTGTLATASRGVLTKTAREIPVNGGVAIENSDKSVKCTVSGNLESDGTLTFDIKAETAKNKRVYELKLVFASTLKQTATDSSIGTATATVKWDLLSVEKARTDRKQKAGG